MDDPIIRHGQVLHKLAEELAEAKWVAGNPASGMLKMFFIRRGGL